MTSANVRFVFATADITPEQQLPLAPIIGRIGVFDKIADQLEANICVARWRDREAILISADTLFIGDIVRDLITAELGLAENPETLFLAATHTHSAPMVQAGMPILAPADLPYARFVASRIATAIKSIRSGQQEAAITYHEGIADHGIHRRLKRFRLTRRGLVYSAELGPNPNGPRDETVRLLKVSGNGGDVIAILWNYACHPTDFPHRSQVSADFPGAVRKHLRDLYGPIPVLYFQGFSGDVRPPFRRKLRNLKSAAYRILWGPEFGTPSEHAWHAWANTLANRVGNIAKEDGTAILCNHLECARQLMPVAAITDGERDAKQISLHALQLGTASIVGWSAEAVTRYRAIVEAIFPERPLLTVNCLDQNQGYLPAESMLPDGGYEVDGFRKRFAFIGSYKPGLEAKLQDQLARLHDGIARRA